MATPVPRTIMLNARAFRAACKARGAVSDQQIAELLGVNRSTVLRILNQQQTVGPSFNAALRHTFGDAEANKMTKVVKKTIAA